MITALLWLLGALAGFGLVNELNAPWRVFARWARPSLTVVLLAYTLLFAFLTQPRPDPTRLLPVSAPLTAVGCLHALTTLLLVFAIVWVLSGPRHLDDDGGDDDDIDPDDPGPQDPSDADWDRFERLFWDEVARGRRQPTAVA